MSAGWNARRYAHSMEAIWGKSKRSTHAFAGGSRASLRMRPHKPQWTGRGVTESWPRTISTRPGAQMWAFASWRSRRSWRPPAAIGSPTGSRRALPRRSTMLSRRWIFVVISNCKLPSTSQRSRVATPRPVVERWMTTGKRRRTRREGVAAAASSRRRMLPWRRSTGAVSALLAARAEAAEACQRWKSSTFLGCSSFG
jgi:hypothetical protein